MNLGLSSYKPVFGIFLNAELIVVHLNLAMLYNWNSYHNLVYELWVLGSCIIYLVESLVMAFMQKFQISKVTFRIQKV